MNRLDKSRAFSVCIFLALFALLLICNFLSPMICDDFAYSFSFATREPITEVGDIIPSMAAHSHKMNGRLTAHFLAQLMLLLPPVVFDLVNSVMFVLQLAMMAWICRGRGERSNFVLLGIFSAIWIFELRFGQVNLWTDGSCNYLWNVVFGLMFLLPFVREFLFNRRISGIPASALFILFSFPAGAYGEAGSAACIGMAILFVLLFHFYQHKKGIRVYILALISAVAGYLTMFLCPAEAGHAMEWTLTSFLMNVYQCFKELSFMNVLMVAFAVLFILNVADGTEKDILILSSVFFLGAMGANFVLLFAMGYAERVTIHLTVLLIIADGILLQAILPRGNHRVTAACMLAALLVVTPSRVIEGLKDIYVVHGEMMENIAVIEQEKQAGNLDIVLPLPHPKSSYSIAYDMQYLDTKDPDTWPNDSMARYFGVNSLLGQEVEEDSGAE